MSEKRGRDAGRRRGPSGKGRAAKTRSRGRRLLLVVPRPKRTPRLPFFAVAFAVVGLAIFGVVSLQAMVSQSSFRMKTLQERNASLQQSYGRLELEVTELSSPERLAQKAHQLGLQLPDQVEPVTVDGPARPKGVRPGQHGFALPAPPGEGP